MDALERDLDKQKKAGMPEADRYRTEAETERQAAATWKQKHDQLLLTSHFKEAAAAAGCVDPAAAARLADFSKLTLTEDGQIHGVDRALKQLKESYKSLNLFTPAPRPGVGGGGNVQFSDQSAAKNADPNATTIDAWIRQQSGR